MRPVMFNIVNNRRNLFENRSLSKLWLAAGLMACFCASPLAQVAWADEVITTGAMTLSADTAVDGTFADLTTEPAILEAIGGEWDDATEIRLTAPAHYAFDTASPVTAAIVGTLDLGNGSGISADSLPAADLVTFTVTGAHVPPSQITFSGIRLRATDDTGAVPGSVEIMVQVDTPGNANLLETPTALVAVTVEPGAPAELVFDAIPSPQVTGVSFDVNLCVNDQFGNASAATADTTVQVFVLDGTGGLSGDRIGTIFTGAHCTAAGDINVAYNVIESGVTLAAYAMSGNDLLPAFSNAFDVNENTADIDLVAIALTYDSVTQLATLSYTVDSPVNVAVYEIEFFLDRDKNGAYDFAIDGPAIDTVGGVTTPGEYPVDGDFSAAPPDADQLVFAVIDRVNQVEEGDESNNIASAMNTAALDLVAVSLVYDSVIQEATFSYFVVAPTNVAPYAIELTIEGTPIAPQPDSVGNVTPGAHTATFDLSGSVPASGDMLEAILDPADQVTPEDDEGNNTATTTNSAIVDLILNSVSLTANDVEANVTVAYTVFAPTSVEAYTLLIGLDTDGDTTTIEHELLSGIALSSDPGQHYTPLLDVRAALDVIGVQDGYNIVAILDPDGLVGSDDLGNNRGSIEIEVDLVAVALTYDSVVEHASLSYFVIAPAAIAPYEIELSVAGTPIVSIPGEQTPGAHVANDAFDEAIAANVPASGAELSANVDFTDAIVERDPDNNSVNTNNTAIVDIAMNSVSLTATNTEANVTVAYTVFAPTPVAPYTLRIGLDTNGTPNSIEHVLLDGVVLATDPGQHYTLPLDVRAALDLLGVEDGYNIVAILDAGDAVAELAEDNNQGAATIAVDLVAIALAYDSVATEASFSYFVISPAATLPYDIELSVGGTPIVPQAGSVGKVTPGAQTATFDLSGDVPAVDAVLDVMIDPGDAVAEGDDLVNNAVQTTNTAIVDLEAVSLTYDSVTRIATLGYNVFTPTDVPAYTIAFYLDRDGDGQFDVGNDGPAVATVNGSTVPGPFTAPGDFTAEPVGANQMIFAVLDPADNVQETKEDSDPNPLKRNNHVSAMNTAIVNIVMNGVAIENRVVADDNKFFPVNISYTINSPVALPPFQMRLVMVPQNRVLALVDVQGTLLQPGPQVITPAVAPSLNLTNALLAAGLAAGQAFDIDVQLDWNNTIAESNEADNDTQVSTSYPVDLRIDTINFPGTDVDVDFGATVNYSVVTNPLSQNFIINLYASADSALTITADDILLRQYMISRAVDKTVGSHSRAFGALRVSVNDFNTGEFFLKAVIDRVDNLSETDETNNVLAAQNINPSGENVDFDGDELTAGEENDGFDLSGIMHANGECQNCAADDTKTFDDDPDNDKDGLSDKLERDHGTNPKDKDTDGDGIPDGVEDANLNGIFEPGLSETDPRLWDTDGDGLSDNEESLGYTITVYAPGSTSGRFSKASVTRVYSNPLVADTDGDGISDWDEVNTWAREATKDAMESAGLLNITARNLRPVNKQVMGVRTNPSSADTDGDGLRDDVDPAPQINPARWGYDMNGDGVFNAADLEAIRAEAVAAGEDTTNFPATIAAFQRRLIDFDQDGDGFMEAPDANGDGFPDFTRYNESTLEQAFGIDFSNDGTLGDGFDVGGLGEGPEETPDPRPGSVSSGIERFGTFRVIRATNGAILGDGSINEVDSISQLIPTDNCPNNANPDQLDYDGDGLGDECDSDLDNDGVANNLDPVVQAPGSAQTLPGLCGFGAFQSLLLTLLGLAGWRRYGGYSAYRR